MSGMKLYKYVKQEHLEAFFDKGTVKIGSLYEYRKVEMYGDVIGDDMEGAYNTVFEHAGSINVDFSKNTAESIFLRQQFGIERKDYKLTMNKGAKIIFRQESPDYYIYCMTTEFNQDVMKEFGCDSCIEITDPELFLTALSKAIIDKAEWQLASKIAYRNKDTSYLEPHEFPPVITKSLKYKYQCELRGIWKPYDVIDSPIITDVPEAIGACRVYKF